MKDESFVLGVMKRKQYCNKVGCLKGKLNQLKGKIELKSKLTLICLEIKPKNLLSD